MCPCLPLFVSYYTLYSSCFISCCPFLSIYIPMFLFTSICFTVYLYLFQYKPLTSFIWTIYAFSSSYPCLKSLDPSFCLIFNASFSLPQLPPLHAFCSFQVSFPFLPLRSTPTNLHAIISLIQSQ